MENLSKSFTTDAVERCATVLEKARKTATPIPPLTNDQKDLGLNEGYRIQQAGIAKRVKAGDPIVGYKMGLTSKVKMEQMGLHTPIYGVLLKSMQVKNKDSSGWRCTMRDRIHPKIEPEVAFIMKSDLKQKASHAEALAAIEGVMPAFEVLDSRFRDFKYFSLPDVVADNSSSCDFILGQPISPQGIDLKNIHVSFEEDGKPMHEALSNAALGDPVLSLCELVSLLWEYEKKPLPAGSIVLTGALTVALPLRDGQKVRGIFKGLGELNVTTGKD